MGIVQVLLGLFLLLVVLWDTFETIIMPRTVSRRIGLTRAYYDTLNGLLRKVIRKLTCSPQRRESILTVFGPMSLVLLIVVWALLLILGFALLLQGLAIPLTGVPNASLAEHLYLSAETFFTLGYGDMTATNGLGRFISTFEAGTGFGFLAAVISYFPVLYQAFSRREATALLLDARAGSPPVGSELLMRYCRPALIPQLEAVLAEFERWSAQLLETYLSYPLLLLYRSQHEKLSWLASLTAILDATAILQIGFEQEEQGCAALIHQAELTFAMARHLAVDVSYIMEIAPIEDRPLRLSEPDQHILMNRLAECGLALRRDPQAMDRFRDLRSQYEPFLIGLSEGFFIPLPTWLSDQNAIDSWQKTAWDGEKHF